MQAPVAGQTHHSSQSQVPSQSIPTDPVNSGFPVGQVAQGPIPHLTQSNQNLAPFSQGQSTGVQNIVSPVGMVHNATSLPPGNPSISGAPQVQVVPPPEAGLSQGSTPQHSGQVVGSTVPPRQTINTSHISHPGVVTVPNPAATVPMAVQQPIPQDGTNFHVSGSGQSQVISAPYRLVFF